MNARRLRLIACEVLLRELCEAVARAPRVVDPEFLTQGLHDLESGNMARRIQEAIDRADPELYEGICLGFALCNNGLVGVRAREIPVVIPRAHDCITLLMGSPQRYETIFRQEPGTYFQSPGWHERDHVNLERVPPEALAAPGLNLEGGWTGADGRPLSPEEAEYLKSCLGSWRQNYRRLVFIDTGLGDLDRYRSLARQEAEKNGWTYEEVPGDTTLLRALVDGPPWDPNLFLVLEPGHVAAADPTGEILSAEEAESG